MPNFYGDVMEEARAGLNLALAAQAGMRSTLPSDMNLETLMMDNAARALAPESYYQAQNYGRQLAAIRNYNQNLRIE